MPPIVEDNTAGRCSKQPTSNNRCDFADQRGDGRKVGQRSRPQNVRRSTTLRLPVLLLTGALTALAIGCDGRQPAQSGDAGLAVDLGGGSDTRSVALDMNPSCPPDADPELAVTLKLNMGGVVAVVTNVGCKPAYRMVGCCGEGDPIPQVPSGSGGWIDAQCSSIGSCCEKPPHCVGLEPGQSVEVPVSALEQRRCCGRTYRVGLPYSRDPSCNEYDSLPGLIAYSNSVTLATPDPCEGKTPCGPKALTNLPPVAALVCEITAVVARRLLAASRRPPRSYAVIPHPSRSSVRSADQRSSRRPRRPQLLGGHGCSLRRMRSILRSGSAAPQSSWSPTLKAPR